MQLAGTVDSEPLVTKSSKRMLFTVLTRPIRMFFGEPLVFFTDIFLVLEYAMFFLYFEAYPIIFEGTCTSKGPKSTLNGRRNLRHEPWGGFPRVLSA